MLRQVRCENWRAPRDNLSTILLALFINDQTEELKSKGCGISIADGIKLCYLFYVDDIVILEIMSRSYRSC